MSADNTLAQRVDAIKRRIADIGGKDVTLVAVTKTIPPERINPLIGLGVVDIGENRVQEWMDKLDALDTNFRVHQIGRLQTNKVKLIVKHVFLIHSVDRLSLLEEIDKQASNLHRTVDVLLQLNLFDEPQKGGVSEDELPGLMKKAQAFEYVRVRGLMGIAPDADAQTVRAFFKGVNTWYDRLRQESLKYPMGILSMGMSGDYETAVEEGANMVRIGGALFGSR